MNKTQTIVLNDPGYNSLHELFLNAANNIHTPSKTYLLRKENGNWREYSYAELLTKINSLAAWFMELGLQKGDRVAILMENNPEYYCIDQALQKLGLVNVSIYSTLTPEETQFIINDSGAKVLFIGNHFSIKKFKKIESDCPTIIQVVGIPEDLEQTDKFHTFTNVIELGGTLISKWTAFIEAQFKTIVREDLSTLIYTSGTTGVPKGAMLTHGNFITNCFDAYDLVPDINKDDRYLSFLPLCHVYERMATYYLGTYIGAQVAFAESIEKVSQNIGEVRPSIMACVPRLLEKIHDKVVKNATGAGGIKKAIFFWALGVGEKARVIREKGQTPGFILAYQHKLAEKLVYSKLKAKMGGKMKLFVSGGGALPKHVGEFFGNLGLKVQEGFGLTETSPFITVNEYNRQIFGTVGRIAPRQKVAIQNIVTGELITEQSYYSFNPDFESEEGEILAMGPNIMKGYWNNPSETAKVFDNEGWFHTGDIGKFEKGYLKITDRLKNMLVTSLGKNVFPTQVENIYLRSAKIEQIIILGDKREYITAIIIPNAEELEEKFGVNKAFFEESDGFIVDQKIVDWLNLDIRKLSEQLAKFERIKEFIVKRNAFSIENGELTATLKIKRKVVMEKFSKEIESMY